jgi:aspartyl-tRNA(Asn)/glutamyl-tRNA(Gln) amidotransferase subunit A
VAVSATDAADLGVVEAAAAISERELSSAELVGACLRRIEERDGSHSFDGDPDSINAWARVFGDEAVAAAERADTTAAEERGPLHGVPVGLKDIYSIAGKPLSASSRVLEGVPERDCDAWARLRDAGMIALGQTHTHEFAVGGTTDQVGNPWALERTAGGSSGGSGAALAAHMIPAATGTDTAGSLRIPSTFCGTSTIKPTYGLVSARGIIPLSTSFDHPGPMARSVADCAAMLAPMAGFSGPASERTLAGSRLALSPRLALLSLDPDVRAGFDRALETCRRLGAEIVEPPPPEAELDVGEGYLDILCAELTSYHRRFAARRALYRPALREWVDEGERRATSAIEYEAVQAGRREDIWAWTDWLEAERITAVIEPTEAVAAPVRGDGYEHMGTDEDLISLTYYWNWTGFPVVSLPAGVGSEVAVPVGVSLIGPPGADWDLLAMGIELQAELGLPEPPIGS